MYAAAFWFVDTRVDVNEFPIRAPSIALNIGECE